MVVHLCECVFEKKKSMRSCRIVSVFCGCQQVDGYAPVHSDLPLLHFSFPHPHNHTHGSSWFVRRNWRFRKWQEEERGKKKQSEQRGQKGVPRVHPEYLVQTSLRANVNTRMEKAQGHLDCFSVKENPVVKRYQQSTKCTNFSQKTETKVLLSK